MQETTVERLAKISGDLPSAPAAVLRTLKLAQEPETTVEDLQRVIEGDPGLATKLLRVANSAYYRRSREVSSVGQAILALGFRTILSLTLASSSKAIFERNNEVARKTRETLWDHSISTAFVAAQLAKMTPAVVDAELCFVGGLLHDIGKVLIARNFPAQFAAIRNAASRPGSDPLGIEEKVLGFRHDELGAFLAREWGFPDSLVAVIRHHHDFHDETEAATVCLADHVATRIGWNFPTGESVAFDGFAATTFLRFEAKALEAKIPEVRENVEELKSVF